MPNSCLGEPRSEGHRDRRRALVFNTEFKIRARVSVRERGRLGVHGAVAGSCFKMQGMFASTGGVHCIHIKILRQE